MLFEGRIGSSLVPKLQSFEAHVSRNIFQPRFEVLCSCHCLSAPATDAFCPRENHVLMVRMWYAEASRTARHSCSQTSLQMPTESPTSLPGPMSMCSEMWRGWVAQDAISKFYDTG
eukprot:s321_g20.t1